MGKPGISNAGPQVACSINRHGARVHAHGAMSPQVLQWVSCLLESAYGDAADRSTTVSRFWSLVFAGGSDYPSTPEEEAWVQLHVSEAALAEISMSAGVRYWSPGVEYQEKAAAHAARATQIVIQRIRSGAANTAAIIGAVLSMAMEECMKQNDHAWNIHVDGLAEILTKMHSEGVRALPPHLCKLLMMYVKIYLRWD